MEPELPTSRQKPLACRLMQATWREFKRDGVEHVGFPNRVDTSCTEEDCSSSINDPPNPHPHPQPGGKKEEQKPGKKTMIEFKSCVKVDVAVLSFPS